MRTSFTLAFILMILISPAGAEPLKTSSQQSVSEWLTKPASTSLGLIDPTRLNVNHTISFGTAFSGDRSLTSTLYASNFVYRLSNPVTLNFTLGIQNNRVGGLPEELNGSSLFGGFALEYRKDDFLFKFEMQRVPTCGSSLNSPYSTLGLNRSLVK